MALARLRAHPALAALCLASVLLLAALGRAFYVRDLADALVREANEIVAAPRARPTHVDLPSAGTFGEALRRHLPAFDKASRDGAEDEAAKMVLDSCVRGELPLSSLSAAQRALVATLGADLDGLLAGTHARAADLVPDAEPLDPLPETSWLGLQTAAAHAAIRIREDLALAEPQRAVADCLDGLALGRDAAISGGLIGQMVDAAIVKKLAPACADLLAALPLPSARDAAGRLRRIRDAVPSFAEMLREEAIQMQLMIYGRFMGDARSRLLPRPARFAEEQLDSTAGVTERLRVRVSWRPLRAVYVQLIAAAGLAGPARGEALERVDREHPWLIALLGDGGGMGTSFASYSRIDSGTALRLDLLVAATAAREFRESRGRWPAGAPELASASLLQPGEAARLAGLLLTPELGGDAVRLTIPLPKTGDLESVEFALRVYAGDRR